jgi:hypothetical protein
LHRSLFTDNSVSAAGAPGSGRSMRRLSFIADDETILVGQAGSDSWLMAIFEPIVTAAEVSFGMNRLLKWLRRNEDQLFMLELPVWKS